MKVSKYVDANVGLRGGEGTLGSLLLCLHPFIGKARMGRSASVLKRHGDALESSLGRFQFS